MMVTTPSGAMSTKAESSARALPGRTLAPSARTGMGINASSANPPPASNEALRTVLRSRLTPWESCNTAALLCRGRHARCNPDGASDTVVATATANVACHGGMQLLGVRLGSLAEQRARRHDLTGLAIPALHDIDLQPRLL